MRPSPTRRVATAAVAVLSAGALSVGFLAAPAEAAADPATRLAERLVRQTNGGDANRHLIALQRISDRNGGNRAAPDGESAAAPGYEASVEYVSGQLRRAGYLVDVQDFTYPVETSSWHEHDEGRRKELPDRQDDLQPSTPRPVGSPVRSVPSRTHRAMPLPAAKRPTSPDRTSPAPWL